MIATDVDSIYQFTTCSVHFDGINHKMSCTSTHSHFVTAVKVYYSWGFVNLDCCRTGTLCSKGEDGDAA